MGKNNARQGDHNKLISAAARKVLASAGLFRDALPQKSIFQFKTFL